MMQKILLIILISVFSFSLHAQQQTSTDLIRRGIELHDEEKFQEAIDVYKQINENDSLYDYMLYEISYSFMQLEEYDSAIYYVNIGLELESSNQKLLLQQLATAYDNSGDPEKAIEIYTKALEKYPFDYLLYYNLGVTYSNQNEFEKSVECFQNAIINNPFHSTSHLSLGKLMARQGLLTKAIISLEIFLELEPESERSNIVLVYLNELADNHIDTAWGEPIVPFTDNEIFSEVDHFIKSGIALKDNFKTGIKFKASIVNQTVLLFRSLPFDTKSEDFWVKMYFPFLKAVKEGDFIKPYIFTLLSSSGHETVVKYNKRKKKDLAKFYNTGTHLLDIKQTKKLNLEGEEKVYDCSYYDNGSLLTLGNLNALDKESGYWRVYHPNGEIKGEGYFKNGLKDGEWKYYYDNGKLSSIETIVSDKLDGKFQSYYEETGRIHSEYTWYNDEVNGEVKWYDEFGILSAINNFDNTKREGQSYSFYSNSSPKDTFNFKNNELHGDYISYHPNGALSLKQKYNDGKDDGPIISYYADGSVGTTGAFKDGERDGEWISYFINGIIDVKNNFSAGKKVGEEKSYYHSGIIYSESSYNMEGELEGPYKYYTADGILYLEEEYKDGIIVKVSSIDKDGKYHSVTGNSRGTFNYETFDPDHKKINAGAFKSGKRNGVWTYYYKNGKISQTYKYKNGDIIGELKSYHPNGALKSIYNYVDGVTNGQYVSFSKSGVLLTMGYLKDGKMDGMWKYYLKNGKLTQTAFFLNDELHGWLTDYSVDGKIADRFKYFEGRRLRVQEFDSQGNLLTDMSLMDTCIAPRLSDNKIKLAEANIIGGKYEGEYKWYFPDGTVNSVKNFIDDDAFGEYAYYYENGKIRTKGSYIYGKKNGLWTNYFKNGKVSSESYYINDKLDSIATYYFENGKVSLTESYYMGDQDGDEFHYDVTGELLIKITYTNDEIISYQYKKDGELCKPLLIKNGDQKITAYFNNGKKSYEQEFKDFVPHGALTKYYADGTLRYKKNYKNGDIEGTYESYWPNGKIRTEYYCEKNLYQKVYKDYWETGIIKLEIEYQDDSMMGEKRYYDKSGKLTKTEKYWDGRFIGYKE